MLCDSTRGYVLEVHIPTVEPTYAKSPLALLFPLGCVNRANMVKAKAKVTPRECLSCLVATQAVRLRLRLLRE
jgi:hypothetical protein